MRAWLLEELGQRGLDPQQYSHTLLALAQRTCFCDCGWDSGQPPLKCNDSHEVCEEERKQAVMECLSASCAKTAGLDDFVEEICCRLDAVQVQGQAKEKAGGWEATDNASTTINLYSTFPELKDDNLRVGAEDKLHGIFNSVDSCTFCLPKLPTIPKPRLTSTSSTMLDMDTEGFDSAFEDLEPDSICSNTSGKRLYERGWESEESPLNSDNSSRESSEERSTASAAKKERREKNNNDPDGRVTPILTAIEKATDLNLTPRIAESEDSDEFKEFCSKMLSIAEIWENAGNWAGLKDSLASEIFKLDNVSLSFPSSVEQFSNAQKQDDPTFSLEFDLFSLLSARSLLKDTEEIGGSILAGVMCECPSSPKKTVYFSIPDKWFSFQGHGSSDAVESNVAISNLSYAEESKPTPERNARRKLSFQHDDGPIQVKCFKKVSESRKVDDPLNVDWNDTDDDEFASELKGIEPLKPDDDNDPRAIDIEGAKSESWIDSMWQVEAQNSLSPEIQQDVTLGAISTVAEEMIRVILEDTPDNKTRTKWKETTGGSCNECLDNTNRNCSQEFVHHAQQSCFKTVLPGSTRYQSYQDDDCFYTQFDYDKYRNSVSDENLLISSRTHFKPIDSQGEEKITIKRSEKVDASNKLNVHEIKRKTTEAESGADVEEIEKDALESTELMISEVEQEFEFLHSYSLDTSPKCPSVIKRMLEPLELPESSPDRWIKTSSPDRWAKNKTCFNDNEFEIDYKGFSLPCSMGDRTQSKMTNIWKCGSDVAAEEPGNEETLREEGHLFADIDYQRQTKWSTMEDRYEIEQAVPVQYLDDDLLMHTYTLQQELSNNPFDLPALPIDSDGRVLYSSELEEDWKQNSKPFSVQVPKKNKSRKVTANKKACHYFLGGGCARDLDCRYSHDPASITCRFWEQESCLKGITCEFLHAYNHSPVAARRRQHSDSGATTRKRTARPTKHASFEITSHTDFPELSLPDDVEVVKRDRGSTSSE